MSKMKCPLCKRNESETEFRQQKNERVRCMSCGWKQTRPYGWFELLCDALSLKLRSFSRK